MLTDIFWSRIHGLEIFFRNSVTQRWFCDRRTIDRNQLIVGPRRWAYQVLRHTLGERFMVAVAVRVFIKDLLLP